MADRYMLFSTPMIHALLADRKTQTRRVGGVPAIEEMTNGAVHVHSKAGGVFCWTLAEALKAAVDFLPIAVGDRICVRERGAISASKLAFVPYAGNEEDLKKGSPAWPHSPHPANGMNGPPYTVCPAIHMPRWASRLTLVVTDVRVQRLQDISEEDAEAEGFPRDADDLPEGWIKDWYRDLWEAINGAGSWAANPFIAAYTFDVHKKNIDQL